MMKIKARSGNLAIRFKCGGPGSGIPGPCPSGVTDDESEQSEEDTELEEARAAEDNDIEDERQAILDNLMEAKDKELEVSTLKDEKDTEALEKRHERELAKLESQQEKEVEKLEKQQEKETNAKESLDEKHTEQTEALAEKHESQEEKLQERHEKEYEKLEERHQKEYDAEPDDVPLPPEFGERQDKETKELLDRQEAELTALAEKQQGERDKLEARQAEEQKPYENMEERHRLESDNLVGHHQVDLTTMQTRHEQEAAILDKAQTEVYEDIVSRFNGAVAELQAKWGKEDAELKKKRDEEDSKHKPSAKSIRFGKLVVPAFHKVRFKVASADDEAEKLDIIADILGGLYGDDALRLMDEADQSKQKGTWSSDAHPRDEHGRFISVGWQGVENAAKMIKDVKAGKKTAASVKDLTKQLSVLTVKQLKDLRDAHKFGDVKGKLKADLVAKLAEKIGQSQGKVTAEEKPVEEKPKEPEKKPEVAEKPQPETGKPAEQGKPVGNGTDDGAMEQWGNKNFAEWGKSLSNDEVAALQEYTNVKYRRINAGLRENKGNTDFYDGTAIKRLDSALQKATVPETVVSFRGLQTLPPGVTPEVGKTFVDHGFFSTSLRKDVGEAFARNNGYLLEVTVPGGTKAAYVSEFAKAKGLNYVYTPERELLLNRGTKFKITGVKSEGGQKILQVEASSG